MVRLRQGFGGLNQDAYTDLVRRALDEDRGRGDATSAAVINTGQRARGVILAKSELVVAGLDVAAATFRHLDPAVVIEVLWADGSHVNANEPIAFVTGDAIALLTAERTALNFLQRLTGIATLTAKCVTAAAGRITILDTRKTTPGLRDLEKYAVRCGGGANHRQRLDDGILIKDNHKRLAGGVSLAAIAAMKNAKGLPVEVEVEGLAELDDVLATGVPRILLDNFTVADIREAVRRVNGRAAIEISGGVTHEIIPELATTGADFVSVGALTHSAPAADLSFELTPAGWCRPLLMSAGTRRSRPRWTLPRRSRLTARRMASWWPRKSRPRDAAAGVRRGHRRREQGCISRSSPGPKPSASAKAPADRQARSPQTPVPSPMPRCLSLPWPRVLECVRALRRHPDWRRI